MPPEKEFLQALAKKGRKVYDFRQIGFLCSMPAFKRAFFISEPENASMEAAMPSKQEARKYLNERVAEHKPPPSPQEIRERMGWKLIEAAQKAHRSK